jgi:transposase
VSVSATKKSILASEQDRPDVARKRTRWRKYQGRIDPERLVFIDETWTKTNMAPLRGWARRGERLRDQVPFGRWTTMTLIAALSLRGIAAPCLIDGPINGEVFRAWVEQSLVPTLAPGDIVVMDNLGSHKGRAVRDAIRSAGAHRLFLPAYSPDLNPIEQMFAKLKTLLRKARARSFNTVCNALGDILDQFDHTERKNYLRNCGYASS